MAQLDATGTLEVLYIYNHKSWVPDWALHRDGTLYRVVTDQVGSVRAVVNATTGTIVQRYTYSPFGAIETELTTRDIVPHRFARGLYDELTGLLRFGARDYDPEIGSWTSNDPIGFGGGQANLYVYVGQNPINQVDPSGRFTWLIPLAGGLANGIANGISESSNGNGFAGGFVRGFFPGAVGAVVAFRGNPFAGAALSAGLTTAINLVTSDDDVSFSQAVVQIGAAASIGGLFGGGYHHLVGGALGLTVGAWADDVAFAAGSSLGMQFACGGAPQLATGLYGGNAATFADYLWGSSPAAPSGPARPTPRRGVQPRQPQP